MISYVLSGIGFLGTGLIMKQGMDELNAVEMQRQLGVRHAIWEVSTAD